MSEEFRVERVVQDGCRSRHQPFPSGQRAEVAQACGQHVGRQADRLAGRLRLDREGREHAQKSRVPAGLAQQGGAPRPAEVTRQQRERLLLGERRDFDTARGGGLHLGVQQPPQRLVRLTVAVREDEHHPAVRRVPQQMADQLHRRVVGPVHVVQDEQQVTEGGQGADQGTNRVEDVVPLRRIGRTGRGQGGGQGGEHPAQPACVIGRAAGDEVVSMLPYERVERVDECAERDATQRGGGRPDRDLPAERTRRPGHVREESGLAAPPVTADLHHRAPADVVAQQPVELGEGIRTTTRHNRVRIGGACTFMPGQRPEDHCSVPFPPCTAQLDPRLSLVKSPRTHLDYQAICIHQWSVRKNSYSL